MATKPRWSRSAVDGVRVLRKIGEGKNGDLYVVHK
jgi:hypothetical protein